MSEVVQTTKKTVLQAVKELLESSGPFRNRVFIAGADQVPDGVRDKGFITLTINGGSFRDYATGENVVPYDSILSVIIWRSDLTERAGLDEKVLIGTGTSILDNEQKVLQCLTGQYLALPDGKVRLAECLMPVSDTDLMKNDPYFGTPPANSVSLAAMTVQFRCVFHWDLGQ